MSNVTTKLVTLDGVQFSVEILQTETGVSRKIVGANIVDVLKADGLLLDLIQMDTRGVFAELDRVKAVTA